MLINKERRFTLVSGAVFAINGSYFTYAKYCKRGGSDWPVMIVVLCSRKRQLRPRRTCEIHNLAGDLHALPDGEVGADPREEESTEQWPDHGAHHIHAVRDL